ncbi:hypothetical protein HOR11_gp104 [Lactobacillus phage SA-C12]|uniref:Uncharacterized protein n=1 Tax=Lactobacillus phage SA-C12 TaxID=1755697 RepID=A0A1I9KKC8_9CAUD|nr:hypothetical protein HOR11_gp104 [Lactobacillus phage SA-C12]ALY06925.1 hypothetical protein SAC12_104 [Lactobacillus phage SA-C12]
MPKHVKTGQELYLSTIDDNNEVSTQKVYVIDHNHSSIYFGYNKYDRKNSYLKVKASGNFPSFWQPNILDFGYLSDDQEFSKQWEKEVKERSRYKKEISHRISKLFFDDYSVDDYKKVAEFLDEILR